MSTKIAERGLAVSLEVAEPVVVGLSVLAILRVRNEGNIPATVSCRLNMTEGDVRLWVEGPDGSRVIKGWQADTGLRQATLQPGEHIAGGINLLHTDSGATFPGPGQYRLRAEFSPSPRMDSVTSPPVSVTARLPNPGPETEAAALLADEVLREVIVLAKPDAAPQGLRKLAAGTAQSLDANLARLLLSSNGTDDAANGVRDPIRLALEITSLCNPYSKIGKRLADGFATRCARDTAAPESHSAAIATALRIVKGEPFRPT